MQAHDIIDYVIDIVLLLLFFVAAAIGITQTYIYIQDGTTIRHGETFNI